MLDPQSYNRLYLDSIALIVNNPDVWDSSNPIPIPRDIFNGKSFRDIWISVKVADVDPDAFLSSHSRVEGLSINGGSRVDAINTIER